MKILFWGLVSFIIGFILHFIIWKVNLPKGQTKALLQIFCGVLFAFLTFLFFMSRVALLDERMLLFSFWDYIYIAILDISLILAYVVTYSALEVDSPSLVIIKKIADSGRNGLDVDKIKLQLSNDLLVKPRLEDLLNDNLLSTNSGRYKLTSKGLRLVGVFIIFRKILGIAKGG